MGLKIFNNVDIKAICTYLPPTILKMDSLAYKFGEEEVKHVQNGTGIYQVHVAGEDQTSSDLCYEAAKILLEKESIDKSKIDGIVFVSQTFDYLGPASSIILQDRLGLSKDVLCFDIASGCTGYINGIFQASSLIASGACENVLMLAADISSRLIDTNERSQLMVFGDCGSATLLSKGTDTIAFNIEVDGSKHEIVRNLGGGFRPPILERNGLMPKDSNGDSIFKAVMDDSAVFSFIVNYGPKSIRTLLEFMNWNKDEVDFYALHQATRITLDFMRKRLKIDKAKSPFNIEKFGNTGPCTIPLVMTHYCHGEEGFNNFNWRKVIMCAYGVGLTWGSIACDLSKTHMHKPINQ